MSGYENFRKVFGEVNKLVQDDRILREGLSVSMYPESSVETRYIFELKVISPIDENPDLTPNKESPIRPMAMVRRIYDERFKDNWKYCPFVAGRDYLFLGEIIQMPGHGVFLDMETGQTYSGYHIDEFRESLEEETSVTFTIGNDEDNA